LKKKRTERLVVLGGRRRPLQTRGFSTKIVGPTPLMCTTANIKFIPDIKLYIPSTFTLEIKPG
jgi:hypothetical protein